MNDDELLEALRLRMARSKLSQADVAAACGLSQPHLSKILGRKVKLARKTRLALDDWLSLSEAATHPPDPRHWEILVARLASRPPSQLMQIMQLLQILDRLTP